ncbi:MAG: hypothetical protein MRY74_14505 [Neomegalonema sp.]|nr:hypothetical protein [Neomegalonema sp.]
MNRALKKVARAAEVGYLLGPEHITADTSLHRSLLGNPRMLLNIDEFGAWFGRMTGRNSTGNQEALLRMLRNLRTLNGEDLMPAAYSQAARCLPAVRAPALSAIGYSTLQQFADAFRSELEEDGTLARMVEIPCGAPPRRRKDRPRAEFSAELVDVIRAVDDIAANGLPKERILEPKTEGKGDEVEPLPWPGELEPSAALHEVAYPDSLKEAIDQLCDVYDDDARDAEELGWIGAASAIRRAGEHVEKIAMVQAIARNPERPRIDEIDLRLGRQIADYSVKSMVARLRENAGETPYAKDRTRLEAFIEAAGAAGVALNELRRKSPVSGLPHGRRMELLSDLEEIGAIRSGQVPTGGRPQTRYWFAG